MVVDPSAVSSQSRRNLVDPSPPLAAAPLHSASYAGGPGGGDGRVGRPGRVRIRTHSYAGLPAGCEGLNTGAEVVGLGVVVGTYSGRIAWRGGDCAAVGVLEVPLNASAVARTSSWLYLGGSDVTAIAPLAKSTFAALVEDTDGTCGGNALYVIGTGGDGSLAVFEKTVLPGRATGGLAFAGGVLFAAFSFGGRAQGNATIVSLEVSELGLTALLGRRQRGDAPARVPARVPAGATREAHAGVGAATSRGFGECGAHLCKDGQPFALLSGSVHYFRVHPSEWARALASVKAGGFNAVALYLPWFLLEPEPGRFALDAAGGYVAFIDACSRAGLLVFLRVGPYITAELDFGGLPYWLLKEAETNATRARAVRTVDPWWLRRVERYLEVALAPLRGYAYSDGGPIVAVQIDDDSSALGQPPLGGCNTTLPGCKYHGYLAALRDIVGRHGFGSTLVTTVGLSANISTPGVLMTHEFGTVGQSCDAIRGQIAQLRAIQPRRPAIAGEVYPGHVRTFWGGGYPWGTGGGSGRVAGMAREARWWWEGDASARGQMSASAPSLELSAWHALDPALISLISLISALISAWHALDPRPPLGRPRRCLACFPQSVEFLHVAGGRGRRTRSLRGGRR